MKKILIIVIIIAAGAFIYKSQVMSPSANTARYESQSAPISFEYRTGEDGYRLQRFGPNASSPTGFLETLVLMLEKDYQSLERGEREGGEGPPVITLQIFKNDTNLTPRTWVEANPGLSNSPLIMGSITDTDVAGLPAISYQADGLYASRNAVFADNEHVYFASGQFMDRESALYRDFESVLDSIELK